MRIPASISAFRPLIAVVFLCPLLGACKVKTHTEKPINPFREAELPLFDPHVANFTCPNTVTLPKLDAEADAWFREARALENPETFYKDIDYKSIVALTRKAAERNHWKAMLNLASLYVEGRDPNSGEKEAAQLVEKAMALGIPAAYDRMGTYYLNGTGVAANSTHAYALFRKAAEIGSAESMAFLGEKLLGAEDRPEKGWWANVNVGLKMLNCALSRGDGGAAWDLAFYYSEPRGRRATSAEKELAIRILHEGVKRGSFAAARSISVAFKTSPDPAYQIVSPDLLRRDRYSKFATALDFDPSDRFPNLDKVLPLPPAELPPWNGDRDTLLNAARGITGPAHKTAPTIYSQRTGRYFLDSAYLLEETDYTTTNRMAPFEGYWMQNGTLTTNPSHAIVTEPLPALYQMGEAFERTSSSGVNSLSSGSHPVQWKYFRTVNNPPDLVRPMAPAKMTVVRPRPFPLLARTSGQRCPRTGTWQPWVAETHPLSAIINQPWRQAWVRKGQSFPNPERDWFLNTPVDGITWHLMDDSPVDIHSPPKSADGKERPIEE